MEKIKYINVAQHPGVKLPNYDWGVSVTQPDDSLSIQEILKRVSNGLTTGIGSPVDSDFDDPDDNDFDDPTLQPGFGKLDALELATSSEAEDMRNYAKEVRRKQKQKKHEDLINAEVEKRLASRSKDTPIPSSQESAVPPKAPGEKKPG